VPYTTHAPAARTLNQIDFGHLGNSMNCASLAIIKAEELDGLGMILCLSHGFIPAHLCWSKIVHGIS
jgi:hypothetical protein